MTPQQTLLDTIVPARSVDHWMSSTAWNLGRTVTITGEIRAFDIQTAARELELGRLRDGVTRMFNKGEGVTVFIRAG